MRRFYASADNFESDQVTLGVDETRHLRDVLRLEVGDEIAVFDGVGNEFRCSIREITKKTSKALVIEPITPSSPESPLRLTLAAAVLKGDKSDLVVQKAVELGVDRLIPLHAVRCEFKGSDSSKRVDRWRRISLEATKQCGRASLMQIGEMVEFERLLSTGTAGMIMFSERDGESFSSVKGTSSMTPIFGPEGGWDDAEIRAAQEICIPIVTLGGRILRAETAAITITAILQHRFGDFK